MSVEEARQKVLSVSHTHKPGDLFCKLDDDVADLILEVQAAMPCYEGAGSANCIQLRDINKRVQDYPDDYFDGYCPSCKARAELAKVTA